MWNYNRVRMLTRIILSIFDILSRVHAKKLRMHPEMILSHSEALRTVQIRRVRDVDSMIVAVITAMSQKSRNFWYPFEISLQLKTKARNSAETPVSRSSAQVQALGTSMLRQITVQTQNPNAGRGYVKKKTT